MATVKSRGVNYDKFEDSGLLTPYLSESQNRAADAEGFRDFLGKYVTPDQNQQQPPNEINFYQN